MKVFRPVPTEACELCHPIHAGDFVRINALINGQAVTADWVPFEVKLIREDDDGIGLAPSDCPWLGPNALVFSSAAVDAVGSLLRRYGEVLPLRSTSGRLYMYNPTHVLDALEENASAIDRLRSGRIARITRYVFRDDVVASHEIFKITTLFASPTFLCERFVREWRAASLKGLDFEQVWSSA